MHVPYSCQCSDAILNDASLRRCHPRASTKRAVVQQALPSPLLVHGQPVNVRVFVLVTSLSPLRAYVHAEGMVRLRSYRLVSAARPSMRVQPLSRFWRFVERNYGAQSLQAALEGLSDVLVRTLLVAEAVLHSAPSSQAIRKMRCPKCFQLLGVDLTFNTSFYPMVTDVNGQPSFYQSPKLEDEPINGLKHRVLRDTARLLFGVRSVADDVAQAVQEAFENLGIMGLSCQISHDLCLSREDLVFLLDTRRESIQTGGFQQLYPNSKSGQYKTFIDELEQLLMGSFDVRSGTEDVQSSTSQHRTADMHPVVVALQRYFNRRLGDDSYSDLESEPSDTWKGTNTSLHSNDRQDEDIFGGNQDLYAWSRPSVTDVTCSNEPSTMPYLSHIVTEPAVRLQPAFNPQRSEYWANVSYDLVLLKVWGLALHCGSEVRVDDKYAPPRPANYTLGVGENKLVLYVMDGGQPDPWVVNTYTLVIRRLPVTDERMVFSPAATHQVCSLKQECEMQVAPSEPCGLYSEVSSDWPSYLEKTAQLSVCTDGSSQGRWILPCEKCSNKDSCFWREARWQPYHCRYVHLPQRTLSRCMSGKKLLFIGDSTNRGMMHYVMERLNGSLQHWDKTHDIRLYGNLNRGETTASFAYYPQFWLPTSQRPVFDKAVYQLIERSRPLQNNSNTILIVGGVHWLATQHLHMLVKALRSDNLQGIRLIIKTLGAGFHQPVEGIHCLNMNEQKKLMMQNLWLSEFARHYNFDVIDTFNITVARYKDFLQGKCACHFHKVVPLPTPKHRPPGRPPPQPSFHVEGEINAIYSEILLNRICSEHAYDS
ncbi:cadherin-like and PC-esterase domain-containing protein 1 [Ixodes scapularis]